MYYIQFFWGGISEMGALNRGKKLVVIFLMLLILSCLTGCTDDSIYSNVNTDISIENLQNQTMGISDLLSSEKYLNFCQTAKWYSIPIIIISILIGIVLLKVFKGTKHIQRNAICIFIIGIPLFTLVFIYGTCYLYGRFF